MLCVCVYTCASVGVQCLVCACLLVGELLCICLGMWVCVPGCVHGRVLFCFCVVRQPECELVGVSVHGRVCLHEELCGCADRCTGVHSVCTHTVSRLC